MEHWVEINLDAEVGVQDGILLDVLRPHVRRLEMRRGILSFHYFREPEIRFRVRLKDARARKKEMKSLSRIADTLVKKKFVSEWHFGNHGEAGADYTGEEDRYGVNGWRVAEDYFHDGSESALRLLELKRHLHLESPLWAKGLEPLGGRRAEPVEGEGRRPPRLPLEQVRAPILEPARF